MKHLVLLLLPALVAGDLVLSDKMMKLSKVAANLSALAYSENPNGDAYDSFAFFDEEPDQALLAKKDGYCFAAFRGTTLTWDDWQQNLVLGRDDVCTVTSAGPEGNATVCCSTRRGFYQAYHTSYQADLEDELRDCAKSCKNKDECVVLTGHSQGGAIAAVAALHLPGLNPYVITFGQPPTVDAPCPLITSNRWYRFVNTKAAEVSSIGIGLVYDPVPFAPNLGTDDFGHLILLSNDDTGVAYIGLDAQDYFGPLNVNGFEAHSMISANGTYPGYLDRIKALMARDEKHSHPVRTSGYIAGSLCTQGQECLSGQCARETKYAFLRCVGTNCVEDDDCDTTGRCESGVCIPKLGSCMKCDEHSDCIYGHCSWKFLCTGPEGLMDNECSCNVGSDCQSGRCEGFLLNRVCEPALALGAECNENSDCLSGHCSWGHRCVSEGWWSSHALVVNQTSSEVVGREPSSNWKVLVAVAAVALVVVGIIIVCVTGRNRRHGYEQIPAQLTV